MRIQGTFPCVVGDGAEVTADELYRAALEFVEKSGGASLTRDGAIVGRLTRVWLDEEANLVHYRGVVDEGELDT